MTELHPRGVFCASLTPLQADGAPDHGLFVEHCRYLLEEGCDGIALLGTTGEANSFSSGERKAVLEAAVRAGVAPAKLMPGTGVAALTETVELTKHAVSLGVTTVVMLPPFYYKDVTEDGLLAAYAEVVERVADPRLKVVLYHIPQVSAVPITFPLIERLRRRFPGVFTGIKDSAGAFENMAALVERFPDFSVLAGADPLMLPLLREGGAGCITATSNLMAKDLAFIHRHFADAGRAAEVEAAQERVVAERNRTTGPTQIATIKALTAARAGNDGWRRMRPPLVPLSAEQAAALRAK
jgi:4-hydroxy-tetrahydrodipicolinate synthase